MPRRRKKYKEPFPLKDLLAANASSQNKLAGASGMGLSEVNAIANGKQQPTWPTILRIMTTIGARFSELDGILEAKPVKPPRRRRKPEPQEQPAA